MHTHHPKACHTISKWCLSWTPVTCFRPMIRWICIDSNRKACDHPSNMETDQVHRWCTLHLLVGKVMVQCRHKDRLFQPRIRSNWAVSPKAISSTSSNQSLWPRALIQSTIKIMISIRCGLVNLQPQRCNPKLLFFKCLRHVLHFPRDKLQLPLQANLSLNITRKCIGWHHLAKRSRKRSQRWTSEEILETRSSTNTRRPWKSNLSSSVSTLESITIVPDLNFLASVKLTITSTRSGISTSRTSA